MSKGTLREEDPILTPKRRMGHRSLLVCWDTLSFSSVPHFRSNKGTPCSELGARLLCTTWPVHGGGLDVNLGAVAYGVV